MGEPIKSAFEPDPDLDPIQAPPGAEPAPATSPASARPKIVPAEPRLWEDTLTLRFPLIVDGDRLEVLTIRRLTGQQVAELVLEDDEATSLNARARARMAGVHPDVIEALASDDAEAFAEKCRPLLSAGLAAIEERVRADLAGAI